jgi:hypothetical protein
MITKVFGGNDTKEYEQFHGWFDRGSFILVPDFYGGGRAAARGICER